MGGRQPSRLLYWQNSGDSAVRGIGLANRRPGSEEHRGAAVEFSGGAGLFTSAIVGLIAAAATSGVNYLLSADTRRKTRAETAKITGQLTEEIDGIRAGIDKTNAETEKSKAETEKTKTETLLLMKPQVKAVDSEIWGEAPTGWNAGNIEGASDDYLVGLDYVQIHSGKASAYIRAKREDTEGFGALSQSFEAGRFKGNRLRLSGYLRVESVEGWAGLWMRVDGANGELQAFDNMERRPLRGTSEWVRREVVLDVPTDAYAIAIGALLVGPGQVWIDDFALEFVSDDVPLTGAENRLSRSPVNLNFEKG
jgi:hypothetical protein